MAVTEHVITGEDDAALVMAVQAGDVEAYSELFRRHYPAVRRACARRLRDIGEAEEVAQAAFVRALERIDRCGGERRFGAWVHVIAQRLCIDLLRAQTRTMPREDPFAGDRAIGPNTPEERALDVDTAATLRRALSTLPPRQRDVVIARDLEERRPPEIAAAFGLSIGAVDSLLLRARRRLAGAYRAAAGEQGLSTTASSVAVAGGTVAAGNRGIVDAIAAGARAVRDAVAGLPGLVATSPVTPAAVSSPAHRTAAAALAAALALAGAGVSMGGSRTPAIPALRVPAPTTIPLPPLPAPPPPAPPSAPSAVGALTSLVPPRPSPAVPGGTEPTRPVTVPSPALAPELVPTALVQTVTGVVTVVVTGAQANVAPATSGIVQAGVAIPLSP